MSRCPDCSEPSLREVLSQFGLFYDGRHRRLIDRATGEVLYTGPATGVYEWLAFERKWGG